jgi:hypothetical protein
MSMPRPAKLPDLTGVDLTELKLAILAELDRRGHGPEFRKAMRHPQLGDLIDCAAGGARELLLTALATIRRGK